MDQYINIITAARDRLYRLALRLMKDGDEAEDVVQDVLVKSLAHQERILGLDNPPAWLMRMTRHQAIDRIRAREARIRRETAAAPHDHDDRTPYHLTETNDTLSHVERLLQTLPPNQQTVLRLREVEGLEYQEIVKATGLTMAQVKTNLHRGRTKLRALLLNENLS